MIKLSFPLVRLLFSVFGVALSVSCKSKVVLFVNALPLRRFGGLSEGWSSRVGEALLLKRDYEFPAVITS